MNYKSSPLYSTSAKRRTDTYVLYFNILLPILGVSFGLYDVIETTYKILNFQNALVKATVLHSI